jgi:hypothetical protein
MKPFGQLDTSHAMYQPSRRAKNRGLSAYERRQTADALRRASVAVARQGIIPDPHGSQAQKEAWMRERQERQRTARINGQQEAELIEMAHAEVRQRRLREKTTIETEPPK